MPEINKTHHQIFERLPDGWRIDKTCGSPIHGYVYCTNGKSVFNGGERGLVRVLHGGKQLELKSPVEKQIQVVQDQKTPAPQLLVNRLAREQLKAQLLADILIDMEISKLEGWPVIEYLDELIELINSLKQRH